MFIFIFTKLKIININSLIKVDLYIISICLGVCEQLYCVLLYFYVKFVICELMSDSIHLMENMCMNFLMISMEKSQTKF